MSDHQSFQRFAALAAIISFPLALGSIVLPAFTQPQATERLFTSFYDTGVADAPPLGAPNFAAIDAYVQSEMQAARVPGLALGIVQGDHIVHLKGFGIADPSGRPVTPQTPFMIGSTTKSMTAVAIMQLVEADTVELDAPVQQYLPWFRVADSDASARITIRHLLNHTSGLPTTTQAEFITGPNTIVCSIIFLLCQSRSSSSPNSWNHPVGEAVASLARAARTPSTRLVTSSVARHSAASTESDPGIPLPGSRAAIVWPFPARHNIQGA